MDGLTLHSIGLTFTALLLAKMISGFVKIRKRL